MKQQTKYLISSAFQSNRGSSLVEIMVAVIILSFIVIPFGNLLLEATKNNVLSKDISQASLIATSAMEEIKADMNYLSLHSDQGIRTYSTENGYTVKAKITKELSTVSEDLNSSIQNMNTLQFLMQFDVSDTSLTINGTTYLFSMVNPYEDISLIVRNTSGNQEIVVRDKNNVVLKSVIIPNSGAVNVRVKYQPGSSKALTIRTNADTLDNTLALAGRRTLNVYSIEDSSRALRIINEGLTNINAFLNVSASNEVYNTALYTIELSVEKQGVILYRQSSSVKK